MYLGFERGNCFMNRLNIKLHPAPHLRDEHPQGQAPSHLPPRPHCRPSASCIAGAQLHTL